MRTLLSLFLLVVLTLSAGAVQIRDKSRFKKGSFEIQNGVIVFFDKAGKTLGTAEKKSGRIVYTNADGQNVGYATATGNKTTYFDNKGRKIAEAEVLGRKTLYRNLDGEVVGFTETSNGRIFAYDKKGAKQAEIEGTGVFLRPVPIKAADALFGGADYDFSIDVPSVKPKAEEQTVQEEKPKAPAPIQITRHLVVVKDVIPGGEADIAGVEKNDVLLEFGEWNISKGTSSSTTTLKGIQAEIEKLADSPKTIVVLRSGIWGDEDGASVESIDVMGGDLGLELETKKVSKEEFDALAARRTKPVEE